MLLSIQGLRKLYNMSADACEFITWSMLQTVSFAVQDFLVRGLIGFDQSTGAMAVGEGVRVGQRLRFMVRDRDGAMRDLNDHGLALKRRQLQVHAASLHAWCTACCFSACMVQDECRCRSLGILL